MCVHNLLLLSCRNLFVQNFRLQFFREAFFKFPENGHRYDAKQKAFRKNNRQRAKIWHSFVYEYLSVIQDYCRKWIHFENPCKVRS